MANAASGQLPSPKKTKPPRSHWDMLMERRTVEDLEAVLAERLEVIRERRALEARALEQHNQRKSALARRDAQEEQNRAARLSGGR
jgi:hypothetical protein